MKKPARTGRAFHPIWLRPMAAAVLGAVCMLAQAGARTDGSVGAVQTLTGNFKIPETLGTIKGRNLFHSFDYFNIAAGESATFTTASALSNVISRVTGGTASTINGTLTLQAGQGTPAFFLINPAGVTFGDGAWVDVPGAFHVSTANYLKFDDGSKVYADLNNASSFTAAAPEAFGFLGETRASIDIKDGAVLSIKPLQAINVTAGDIQIDNGQVHARGGDMRFAAVGQPATEVPVSGSLPSAYGDLNIRNGGKIVLSSAPLDQSTGDTAYAGSIAISAGNINVARGDADGVTGIVSQALAGMGDAGGINLTASGGFTMKGGEIRIINYGLRKIGPIVAHVDSLTIDGLGGGITGLISWNISGGEPGNIEVVANKDLAILNGGYIRTSVRSYRARGGAIIVSANNIAIEDRENQNGDLTGILADSSEKIEVTARADLSIIGGRIGHNLAGANQGGIKVNAANITINGNDNFNSGLVQLSSSGADEKKRSSNLEINASGDIRISNRGVILAENSDGKTGAIKISTNNIEITDAKENVYPRTGIINTTRSGETGDIEITAKGKLSMAHGIISSSAESGMPGALSINADSILLEKGSTINSDSGCVTLGCADSTLAPAGSININARKDLSILAGSTINANAFGPGNGGSISLNAENIQIDGGNCPCLATGLFSETLRDGNSGAIKMSAKNLSLNNEAGVSTSAAYLSTGRAGDINLAVSETISLDRSSYVESGTNGDGNAGSIKVNTRNLNIGNDARLDSRSGPIIGEKGVSVPNALGNAGAIDINVTENLYMSGRAQISADTDTRGNGGSISILAGNMTLKGESVGFSRARISSRVGSDGSGEGGHIEITTGKMSLMDQADISTSSFYKGTAGKVTIIANTIEMAGDTERVSVPEISSFAYSAGNAGAVNIKVSESLSIWKNGEVTSGAYLVSDGRAETGGRAGSVRIDASTIVLDGSRASINASAGKSTSGPGSVVINASKSILLANGAELAITNDVVATNPAGLTPASISITTPDLRLKNAKITAESSGNVAASNIDIKYTDKMVVDPSYITTSAVDGNGGKISISGTGPLILDRSQVTTSVTSTSNGNGGDISISAPVLVMNTGFIQANTLAQASGGNVNIDVQSLITSGNSLARGGSLPLAFDPSRFGYNAIQAAAPDGVSGAVTLSSPQIDLSGSLNRITAQLLDFGNLGTDLCRIGGGSSLTSVGRGGVIPASTALLSAW